MIEAKPNQSGFILVATIAVVAVLALAASAFTVWVSQATEQARLLRLRAEAEVEIHDAQSIVTYFLSIFPLSARGLELPSDLQSAHALSVRSMSNPFDTAPVGSSFLALDDTPYAFGQSVVVRIQDARGLINLNLASRDQMFALFEYLGIEQERQDPLFAKLRDYIEPGEGVRLGGAKTEEYVRAGKPPPPFSLLVTPWQAHSVLSWDKEPALWRPEGLPALANASLVVGINVNTAPAGVLEVAAGLSKEAAEQVMAQRRILPMTSPEQLLRFGSVKFAQNPLGFITFPADTMRIRLSPKIGGRTVEVTVVLTPNSNVSPWQVAYKLDDVANVSLDQVDRDALVKIPDPKALLAPH